MRVSRNYRALTRIRDLSNNAIDKNNTTTGYGDLPFYIKLALLIRFDLPLISDLISLLIELPVMLFRIVKAIGYDVFELLLTPITLYVYFTGGEYRRRNPKRAK